MRKIGRVYVLMNYCGDEYEGDTSIVGIYSSMEKATAAYNKEVAENDDKCNQFWIDEWRVDEDD